MWLGQIRLAMGPKSTSKKRELEGNDLVPLDLLDSLHQPLSLSGHKQIRTPNIRRLCPGGVFGGSGSSGMAGESMVCLRSSQKSWTRPWP